MFHLLLSYVFSHLLYFALHLSSGGNFPKPLTAKEEKEAFEKAAAGDIAARNLLIEHNMRLVAHIIKKYYGAGREQEDLLSIGTIGLIKAVSTFDYSKGARFATYAARCIDNEVLMYFRSQKKRQNELFIEDPIDTDQEGNSLTLLDIISDECSVIDSIDLKIQSEQLEKSIRTELGEREREILVLRYGLGGNQPLAQREVAERLGISRSYVSRIEKKAIQRLRAIMDRPSGRMR